MDRTGWHNSTVGKVIVLFVALGALVTYLVWPVKLPPPRESDRQWHPEGYSLIAPPNWEPQIEVNSRDPVAKDRLGLRPKSAGHWQPRLTVTRRKQPADVEKLKLEQAYQDGTFQTQPAIWSAGPEKLQYWVCRVLVQRQGEWFEISASVPQYEDIPHSPWWAYLESFQYDPSRAVKPATTSTLPASLPSTFNLRPATRPGH